MPLFQNFNAHSLRSTRGFKLKASSATSLPSHSPQQQPLTPNKLDTVNPYHAGPDNFRSPPSSTNNAAQSVSSHKDIRNYAEQTLGSDNALIQAVKLPLDEDLNEWLAIHVVDFYNQINMLYGAITEFCSPVTCPRMIATEEYEYLWQDSSPMSAASGLSAPAKPVSLPACEYIENLLNWIQTFFDNDNVFPTKTGAPFPQQFPSLIKTIFKRLFRVYAHVYCHHFHEISELGLQSHLNTSLKHYALFANEFGIVRRRDYGPLEDLVDNMLDN